VVGRHGYVATSMSNRAEIPADAIVQGVCLEDGKCFQTTRPNPVEPDPERALAWAQTQLAVFVGGHRQLLSEREDLQVEDTPA